MTYRLLYWTTDGPWLGALDAGPYRSAEEAHAVAAAILTARAASRIEVVRVETVLEPSDKKLDTGASAICSECSRLIPLRDFPAHVRLAHALA